MTNSENRDLRKQILSTAMSLFIQQGYHGLSMREISESLGVSKAALYYYFKDKERLFLAVLEAYLDEMESAIDHIQAQPVLGSERIRLLVRYILGQPAEKRAIIRLSSQEMAQISPAARQAFNQTYHRKFIDRIKAVLQSGMQDGEFRSMDSDIAAWALLGIMYPYFYPSQTGKIPLPEDTVQAICTLYLEGIQV